MRADATVGSRPELFFDEGRRGRPNARIARAAARGGGDRATVSRGREGAKDGARAGLAGSKPGSPGKGVREGGLEEANAEIDRLAEAVKELAVKLMLLEKKGGSE